MKVQTLVVLLALGAAFGLWLFGEAAGLSRDVAVGVALVFSALYAGVALVWLHFALKRAAEGGKHG